MCRYFKRRDFVFENCQICSSKTAHCRDGSLRGSMALMVLMAPVSVTQVVELANHDILPLCPAATEELLFLRVDKSVHTPGHTPTWLFRQPRRACPSSWNQAPSSRVWLQKRCLLPRGNTQSVEGLHFSCGRLSLSASMPHCIAVFASDCLQHRVRNITVSRLSSLVSSCLDSGSTTHICDGVVVSSFARGEGEQRRTPKLSF